MALPRETLFCFLLVLAVCRPNPITINAGKADPPDDRYLLKNSVTPTNYKVELNLPVDFGTSSKFTGKVAITIRTTTTTTNKDKISFHVNKKYVQTTQEKIKLLQGDTVIPYINFNQDDTLQMMSLEPQQELKPSIDYTLLIEYDGVLATDMYGFYKSSYKNENGETEWIATTQFQPTEARRAFPCFDEPKYKAEFDIIITHPKEYHALSNAGIESAVDISGTELKKTTFNKTPKMSTYIVAFLVSKYVGMKQQLDTIENSAWSPIETIDSAKYGLTVAPKVLEAMNKFTGMPYDVSTLGKLDQVSIPDFSAGAMENWGLVTYRETALLWDPSESSARNKQRVADVVGHELAHMWFGNLVTLKWWDSTWLNEGFARYFEYHATAAAEPSWELDKQFVVEQHQVILNSDSISSSKALTSDAFSPDQVKAKFSSTTYSKGGSVIRMMRHFLGDTCFTAGLTAYIKANQFGNTVPTDLWNAFKSAQGCGTNAANLDTIMESWIKQGGFPVVKASIDENKGLVLEQKQFLFNTPETTPTTIWHIPITYTTSTADRKEFENTAPKRWLTQQKDTIPSVWTNDMTWILLNIKDTAFMRVNYDNTLWNGIKDALNKNDFDNIDPLNRAEIVDDAMNLARAGELEYETALDVVFYLENEIDYYPWYPAFNSFAYLRRRLNSESNAAKLVNKYVSRLMENFYKDATAERDEEDTHIQTHARVLALTWGCQLDKEECVNLALERFGQMKKRVPVDPNIRGVVYCTALRHSSNIAEDWEYLWKKFLSAKAANEASNILTALGCTTDTTTLKAYLAKSIEENSGIRSQDAQSVFSAVVSGTPQGVAEGLAFLQTNYKQIANRYGSMNALSGVISTLADRLTDTAQVEELKAFIKDKESDLTEVLDAANSAIQSATANLAWVEKYSKNVEDYLQSKVGGGEGGNEDDDGGATSIAASFVTLIFSIIVTCAYKL